MTRTSQLHRSVPRWAVTLDDITDLLLAAQPRLTHYPYPTFALVFSCSRNGTWPTTSLGYIRHADRHYVDGCSTILDAVARLMINDAESPTGGRFTITLDGATRTRDGAPIATFELTA